MTNWAKIHSLPRGEKFHGVLLFEFLQVAQCGKPFTSLQTSTQRARRPVSTHMSAFAQRTMWPTTILHYSLISRGTHQKPRHWLLTPSWPFTPSWLWWKRLWRGIRDRWSLWRARYLQGMWCGSPGCSPAAPHLGSSVSASRTNRTSLGLRQLIISVTAMTSN